MVALAAARVFSVALTADGRAFAWGSDLLGLQVVSTPRWLPLEGVVSLAAGWYHALLLMDDGARHHCHSSTPGPPATLDAHHMSHVPRLLPCPVPGSLAGFGADDFGQLGGTEDNAVPQIIAGLPASRLMAAGAEHSLVVAADGAMFAFGNNDAGQLGQLEGDTPAPTLSTLPSVLAAGWVAGSALTGLAAGRYHSMALLGDGTICTWGGNARGQLGVGAATATTLNLFAAPCFNLSAPVAVRIRAVCPPLSPSSQLTGVVIPRHRPSRLEMSTPSLLLSPETSSRGASAALPTVSTMPTSTSQLPCPCRHRVAKTQAARMCSLRPAVGHTPSPRRRPASFGRGVNTASASSGAAVPSWAALSDTLQPLSPQPCAATFVRGVRSPTPCCPRTPSPHCFHLST